MSFQVGVLLGAYDGTQSFDKFDSSSNFVLGSWATDPSNLSYDPTDRSYEVHSSDHGVVFNFDASSHGAVGYSYLSLDNNANRLSTDVSTHRFVFKFWAGLGSATDSGTYIGFFGGETVPIAHSDTSGLVFHEIDTNVTSSSFAVLVNFSNFPSGAVDLYMDSVLAAADVVDLCPSREQENIESQNRSDSVTLGGRYVDYKWSDQKRFNVPVRYLPSSEAALFNRWWKNGYNLMFTDNTSDENTIYITRLANTQQPFSNPMRPYNDLFEGTLVFEVIDFGLEF